MNDDLSKQKNVPPQMDPRRHRHQANEQKKIDEYFNK